MAERSQVSGPMSQRLFSRSRIGLDDATIGLLVKGDLKTLDKIRQDILMEYGIELTLKTDLPKWRNLIMTTPHKNLLQVVRWYRSGVKSDSGAYQDGELLYYFFEETP